jgi:hypothetical protein
MTIFQRWKKALANAIYLMLFVLLVDRLLIDRYFESHPFNEAIGTYGMMGLGYLFGWFDGSGTQTQAKQTNEPAQSVPLPPPPVAGRPKRDSA